MSHTYNRVRKTDAEILKDLQKFASSVTGFVTAGNVDQVTYNDSYGHRDETSVSSYFENSEQFKWVKA